MPARVTFSVSLGEAGGVGLLPFTLKVVVELGVALKVSLAVPPCTVRLVTPLYGRAPPPLSVTLAGSTD